MAIDYTTTGLIAGIKRRGSIPTSQALFLAADFIALLNDQLFSVILPLIHRVRQDYFLTFTDTAFVANQAAYTIPTRAAGVMLRDVVTLDSSGNEGGLTNLGIAGVKNNNGLLNNSNFGFYFKDNKIILYPTPATTDLSLRFKYERRPNLLIPVTSAGLIQSVDVNNRQVTMTATPSGFTTSKLYDLISNIPPFISLGDDLVVTNIAANVVTFSAALPDGLAAGMYVCEMGESPIPQLPVEAHFLAEQLACVKCLEAMNDKAGLEKAKTAADKMLADFEDMIAPRVDESPEKAVNRGGIFDYSAGGGWPNRRTW